MQLISDHRNWVTSRTAECSEHSSTAELGSTNIKSSADELAARWNSCSFFDDSLKNPPLSRDEEEKRTQEPDFKVRIMLPCRDAISTICFI